MAISRNYGRRLIPNIIDGRARDDPERVVYSIPVSSTDFSLGFRDVNARDLANAINRTAWWLKSALVDSLCSRSVGYIGPHDIRYVLLVLGCAKVGLQTLLLSPRNSVEACLSVLEASKCYSWVTSEEQPKVLAQLLAKRSMKVATCASIAELLKPDLVPDYPYNKSFEQASEETLCINHTSGSTGNPKPIFWKHSLLATLDATRLLPVDMGRLPWVSVFEEKDRFCSIFPFFHTAGAVMNILIPAFYGTCNVLAPAGRPASLDLVDNLLDHGRISVWHIIPSIIDEIGETLEVHAKFTDSKVMIASGGPVTYSSANKATQSIRIINITGTSEGLFQGSLLPDPEDWIYFAFHPYACFEFRMIEPGLYEHFAVRKEEYLALFQGLFRTFSDVKEMSLKDLYCPHPTKPGLWLYKGRTDDMIVLSSGEKIHPTDMEATVNEHPLVSACLMAGSTHLQAVLLVEPLRDLPEAEKEVLLDQIYETIRNVNASVPSYARIARECIIFTNVNKPFARTDKGTFKRRRTIDLYKMEIDECYQRLESPDARDTDLRIDLSSLDTTLIGVRNLLTTVLSTGDAIEDDTDFFSAGVDSVLATRFIQGLRQAAHTYNAEQAKMIDMSVRLVYGNPSIKQLSIVYHDLMNRVKNKASSPIEVQIKQMKRLRNKYDAKLPRNLHKPYDQFPTDGNVVMLTGSTGALGSYLLEGLLQMKNVKRVYCLNRGKNVAERQRDTNEQRGLQTSWLEHRVSFLTVDLSKRSFGLDVEQYDEMLQQVTHIIHNQWPVNLNFEVASFEPYICGVRHLVDFSLESKRAPMLFFISTIASVRHMKNVDAIPEAPIEDLSPNVSGYYSSKQVSELILHRAWERSGVDARICRLGQMAGPVLRGEKGMWAKQEWVSVVIASSKYLGALPSTLGALDSIKWIPVDLLAAIVLELSDVSELRNTPNGASHGQPNGTLTSYGQTVTEGSPGIRKDIMPVYHAVNPEETNWAALVPCIREYFGDSIKEVVSWVEWVDKLAASQADDITVDLDQNPGLKLLEWFRSTELLGELPIRAETLRSETKSGALAALPPVNPRWVQTWLKQWNF